jgi:hypothetical protein
MNHHPNQDRDLHSRRSRIELPYPGSPSPPQSNVSAQQYRAPELHRAESIASNHSYHSRHEHNQNRHDQRPRSPPADPPTPPMSHHGSLHDIHSAWQPQAESAIQHTDYPHAHLDHDDSTVIFTPDSSPEGGNDRKPYKDDSDTQSRYDEPVKEGKYHVPSADTRVFSRNGPNGQKEWYDQEGGLTDAEGTIILHEPEDTSRSQISDWGRDRRHHRKPTPDDLHSLDDFADQYYERDRQIRDRDNRGDPAHRQASATKSYKTEHRSPRDTMPDRTEGRTSFAGKGLGNPARYPRKAVRSRDSRSSDYDSSSSESLKKTYKQAPRGKVKAQPERDYRRARSSKYVVSPPQSVSPPRSSRINSRSVSHSRTNDAITVTGENGELKYAYLTRELPRTARSTRHRSVSPQRRDQTRYGDHRARSRSPLSSDTGSITPRDRSRDRNGSVQSIIPRRSRSQDMTLIILMVPNPKSRALQSDSSDSWAHSRIDQSLLNGKTYAPGTLLRKQNDMTVIGVMEDVLDDLKGRKPTTSGSKNTIFYDMGK